MKAACVVRLLLVTSALCPAPAAGRAQEPGGVRGVVFAVETGRPVADVRVHVVGATLATRTDAWGRFEFTHLSAGVVVLRFDHPAHATLVESLEIPPGRAVEQRFVLPSRARVLEGLAVTGRREGAVSGADARVDDWAGPGAVGDALDGVSGVALVRTSGEVGAAYYIRIRGVRSFSFSAAPAVYVDGVRVAAAERLGAGHALELISASAIGRIEVVRGATAPARYGPDARNGVILVTTKRGRP